VATDPKVSATFVIQGYCRRWSIELAFFDSKQYLGLHDPRVWSERSVERAHPMAWFVGTLTVLWYAVSGHAGAQVDRQRSWYPHKVTPTFSDMLGALRLQMWQHRVSGASGAEVPSPECLAMLLQTLSAVAYSLGGPELPMITLVELRSRAESKPKSTAGRYVMKTVTLNAKQRREILERRRQTGERRIFQRLSALLWIDEGRTREEVAELLGVSSRQGGDWLRIYRNKGLDQLCTLHYRGDPARLRPAQVEQLRQEIATGVFHNAEQVRAWIEEQFGVTYSTSGVKDLLHRIGASYHKVSGFFLEGGPEEAASVRAQVSAAPA
jgi:transposase